MKNEIFAKALTDIDDTLIAEAHEQPKAALSKLNFKKLGLIAACAVICFVSLFSLEASKSTRVTYDGKKLNEKNAVEIEFGNPEDKIRTLSSESVLVLKISSPENVSLKVSDGTLFVTEKDGIDAAGSALSVEAPLTLRWLIDDVSPEKSYILTVNDTDFSLFWDGERGTWKILEQRKD